MQIDFFSEVNDNKDSIKLLAYS